jgi:hypothetical protein
VYNLLSSRAPWVVKLSSISSPACLHHTAIGTSHQPSRAAIVLAFFFQILVAVSHRTRCFASKSLASADCASVLAFVQSGLASGDSTQPMFIRWQCVYIDAILRWEGGMATARPRSHKHFQLDVAKLRRTPARFNEFETSGHGI